GMAGEGLRIADIDEPCDQLQRVVESLAGFQAALDSEGKKRGSPAIEIFRDQRTVWAVAEARVVDPIDARIIAEEFSDLSGVLDVAFDAERNRFDSLQQQEGVERRQHGAHGALVDAARALDIRRCAETLGVDEAVIGDVWIVERRET